MLRWIVAFLGGIAHLRFCVASVIRLFPYLRYAATLLRHQKGVHRVG